MTFRTKACLARLTTRHLTASDETQSIKSVGSNFLIFQSISQTNQESHLMERIRLLNDYEIK